MQKEQEKPGRRISTAQRVGAPLLLAVGIAVHALHSFVDIPHVGITWAQSEDEEQIQPNKNYAYAGPPASNDNIWQDQSRTERPGSTVHIGSIDVPLKYLISAGIVSIATIVTAFAITRHNNTYPRQP